MARQWYTYTGVPGGEKIVGNYAVSTFDIGYCAGGTNLCVIFAPAGGAVPSFISQNIKNYIAAGKASLTYFPNGLDQKPYIYMRQ